MVVINNPPATQTTTSDNNGMGFLLGVILIIFVAILFFVYGLPAMTRSMSGSAPSVNVPGKVDVNVHGGTGK